MKEVRANNRMVRLRYSMMIGLILFGILCGVVTASEDLKRTITTKLNPDCPDSVCYNESITLIHTTADGPNDSIHHIWDFTGPPSILIALTEPNASVTIDWGSFMDDAIDAIQISPTPIYSAALVLTKVFVFNDAEDTGSFSGINSSAIHTYGTHELTWVREDFRKSLHGVEVTVVSEKPQLFGDGKIKLKFKCYGERDHDVEFPHLLHSMNATQVDIEFLKLASKAIGFENARIAAEFVLVAGELVREQSFVVSKRKTLDDEHTPGIFELIDVTSPESYTVGRGSYLQYRPVSYTHRERDVSTSTGVHISAPMNVADHEKALNSSLAWSYYGIEVENLLVQAFNVSFGFAGDGFYSKTNYTTWTFVMGYGTAPNERLSTFVMIVACIGLGIPLALLVGGGCYICIKRVRNR